MTEAFLGLGSNLGDKKFYLSEACRMLEAGKEIFIINKSFIYQSEPWGNLDQPLFYNAVIKIETSFSPEKLLSVCQEIESSLGRERMIHWGARTIDIDIVLFDDQIIKTDILIVPHPYLAERDFVLMPLFEIDPDLIIPGMGELADIIKNSPQDSLKVIAKKW